jgi:hypothetical protein
MKIDLPVTVIFDCQATDGASISRAAGHVVGTLRYDTDGDGRDAVLFGSYPPNDKPFLCAGRTHTPEGEPAQAVLAFIPAKTDAKIMARAARSPYDYAVGTEEERTRWQEQADEAIAHEGRQE